MKTLGITGGIGSGKTTVCKHLESFGVPVFYADLEAKKLMAEDANTKQEIVATFGQQSYYTDGTLNRNFLAQEVFGNEEKLTALNQIIHPRVRTKLLETQTVETKKATKLLVYEAALIFETQGENYVDAVLVVHASSSTRLARVVKRDQSQIEQVEARMKHQLPASELLQRADFVIINDGSLASLVRKVERLYHLCLSI